MKRFIMAVAFVLAATVQVQAQTAKNPKWLAFTSVEHNNVEVTGYEVDVVRASDNVVIATLTYAKDQTAVNGAGEVMVEVKVQPVAFGTYYFVARTVAGALKSDNSTPSAIWERSPGSPDKLRLP